MGRVGGVGVCVGCLGVWGELVRGVGGWFGTHGSFLSSYRKLSSRYVNSGQW